MIDEPRLSYFLYVFMQAYRKDTLIDEIGLIEIDPVQVGLFFSLMHERHKKKTTLITSNLGFDQWGSFLKNTQLTAALVDRLTENSHVINMKNCKSLRTRLDQQ